MFKSVFAMTAIIALSSTASAFLMGVNIHDNTDQKVSDLMKVRNLKTARMDLTVDSNVTAVRAQAGRIKANGGTMEVSVQISYQWDNSCPQNFATVEQNSYNETKTLVDKYKDVIYDYELLNEVSLREEIQNEVTWNSAGTSTAPYANKPCVQTMASVLRGMSRAIHDLRSSSGYPLRVILGIVGRDFGFLTYMQQQGVVVDVTGFHIYPHAGDTSILNDPWYGAGGPLAQLAKFNHPVHVNEFNCGEIYDSNYDNSPNSAATKTCFQSYKNHLTSFKNQNLINLESVHLYELLDEPQKGAPENHFGLMTNITSPKVHLYIVTAFAGGNLTIAEQQAVTSLGILSDAQIAAYKASGGGGTSPTPTPNPKPTATPTPTPPAPTLPSGSSNACVKIAEQASGTLSCPQGKISGITFASYGNAKGSCGSYSVGTCNASSTLNQVKTACVGKASCTLAANNSVYGDPCSGVQKTLVVQAVCSSTAPTPTQTPVPTAGTALNLPNNMCVDVSEASTANDAPVLQYTCNGGGNQKWRLVAAGGHYQIVSANSGKCLNVSKSSTANGALITQYSCGTQSNFLWDVVPVGNGYSHLVGVGSRRCIDVRGDGYSTPGVQLEIWDCNNGDNQKFKGF
jgi:hypothetical protein